MNEWFSIFSFFLHVKSIHLCGIFVLGFPWLLELAHLLQLLTCNFLLGFKQAQYDDMCICVGEANDDSELRNGGFQIKELVHKNTINGSEFFFFNTERIQAYNQMTPSS